MLSALLLLPSGAPPPVRHAVAAGQAPATAVAGRIAFIRDGDIYSLDLSIGIETRLTEDGGHSTPRWSASGRWLAFRKGENQLWVQAIDGGAAREVGHADPPAAFAWSPAADLLAYTTADGGLVVERADGAEQHTLVAGSDSGRFSTVVDLAWSPDGVWLAFDRFDPQSDPNLAPSMTLWRVRPDGSNATEILSTGAPGSALTLAGWSTDGSQILYWPHVLSASLLADGTALNIISADGGASTELVRSMLAYRDFVAVDPAGSGRIAVVEGGGREDFTGKSLHLLTQATGDDLALTGSDVAVTSPAWSPAGRYLAYVSMPVPAGRTTNVGIAALIGRHLELLDTLGQSATQALTNDPAYRDEWPRWSPDGSALVFVRVDAAGNVSLWSIAPTGGTPRELVEDLSPPAGSLGTVAGYFGHVDWGKLFDWWPGAR